MTPEDSAIHSEDRLGTLPTFELSYTVDDEDEPTEITIYAEDGREVTTYWITMDVDHAVDLDDVA